MLGDRLVLEGTDWANTRFVTPLDIALRMGAPFLVERGIEPVGRRTRARAHHATLAEELPGRSPRISALSPIHPAMARGAVGRAIRELRMAGVRPDNLVALTHSRRRPKKEHAELQALYRAYEALNLGTDRPSEGTRPPCTKKRCGTRTGARIQAQGDCWTELPATTWTPLQLQLLDALPGERLTPMSDRGGPGAAVPRRLVGRRRRVRVAPETRRRRWRSCLVAGRSIGASQPARKIRLPPVPRGRT